MIKKSYSLAKQYILTFKLNVFSQQVPGSIPPTLGNWIQLNSDGVVKNDSGLASIVGIFRDRHNKWIIGYNRLVGICSALDVELWSILEGLTITIDKGFERVFILSDSLEAVQAIQGNTTKASNSALVKRINLLFG